MDILSSAAEMVANDTNLDVVVKVMLFNLNAKNVNLFHFIAPFLHIQHHTLILNLIIRLNIIDLHLSSSTHETATATQSAIPSTQAVATSTHAATTLTHAAMTTTQEPSGRYTSIYI